MFQRSPSGTSPVGADDPERDVALGRGAVVADRLHRPGISTSGSPSTVIVAAAPSWTRAIEVSDRSLRSRTASADRSASRTAATPGCTGSPTAGSIETTVPANGAADRRVRERGVRRVERRPSPRARSASAAVTPRRAASTCAPPASARPVPARGRPAPGRPARSPAAPGRSSRRPGARPARRRRRGRRRRPLDRRLRDADARPALGERRLRLGDAGRRRVDARLRLAGLRGRGRRSRAASRSSPSVTVSPSATGSPATVPGTAAWSSTAWTGTARPSATTPWSAGTTPGTDASADAEGDVAPPPNSPGRTRSRRGPR